VVTGVPAGLALSAAFIDTELARRQQGYGRGGRMRLERDRVRILSGVRWGVTLGTPIALVVDNLDHPNWIPAMQVEEPGEAEKAAVSPVTVPRPGHADLAGLAKYGYEDVRNVLERSSARETVGRVCAGAVGKLVLKCVGGEVRGRVVAIGPISDRAPVDYTDPDSVDWRTVETSECACLDREAERGMRAAIDEAKAAGESLGGIMEIWAWGLPPGLGGYGVPGERLDGRLMGALGDIPAIKGVEIGAGFENAGLVGSTVHDPMLLLRGHGRTTVVRPSNRAGGIEGGMTNGMPIVVRAAMKPIPTLTKPLPSVDIAEMQATTAHKERSDVTAVPAARVVAEAMVAIVLASICLEQLGGDSMKAFLSSFESYVAGLEARGLWAR